MQFAILIGVLAILWDIYALETWPHRDYTVSGFIYHFLHKYPIIAFGMGLVAGFYIKESYIQLIVGILIGHLTWKA